MEGRGADLGDTVVYPIVDSKENHQFMSTWNVGLKRFEGMMRLEQVRLKEEPGQEGIKSCLGLWEEGRPTTWSGHRGGMVSLETSAAEVKPGEHDSLGLWEENPQGPEGNQAELPSQESSSGYIEEMVAGITQLKLTPPHEIESPMVSECVQVDGL